jgi:hypothetical protein
MSGSTSRLQHLFIVRTWHEPSEILASGQWRGLVEHVGSGQRRYFTRLEDLDQFILQQSAQPASQSSETMEQRSVGE